MRTGAENIVEKKRRGVFQEKTAVKNGLLQLRAG
jgi:hypothetical protein